MTKEQSLPTRMQGLIDKNEDYKEVRRKVDEQKSKLSELEKQHREMSDKIKTDEKTLAELDVSTHKVEPSELPALKLKIDKLQHQILADKNWLIRLTNNQNNGIMDEHRAELVRLEKERTTLFFRIVTSLQEEQRDKIETCLKKAVAYYQLWGEAVSKVKMSNKIILDSDTLHISRSAEKLDLDFNDPQLGRFEFQILLRRYRT